jgi:hypothetical protein
MGTAKAEPTHAENSAENTQVVKKRRGGNPDKIRKYQWRKGCPSPNPGGRPKNLISDAQKDWLKQQKKTGVTNTEAVAAAQGKKALKGDTSAYTAIRDTTEGKPRPVQPYAEEIGPTTQVQVNQQVNIVSERGDLAALIRQIYGLEYDGASAADSAAPVNGKPASR